MGYKQKPEIAAETHQRILEKIKKNGHVYLEGQYQNRQSTLLVWCPEHQTEKPTEKTTFYNYNRCKTGLPCCGKESASKLLTNRKFSAETIEKMTKSANNRPFRGGEPRRWRETNKYRNWREQVMEDYNEECAVTGAKKVDRGDLVVHHLNAAKAFPGQTLIVENGICIHNKVHKQYHLTYGYGNNTIAEFQEFLLSLIKQDSKLISSQANSEGLEGSETRAYDPERVMELHERLEEIKALLNPESEFENQEQE